MKFNAPPDTINRSSRERSSQPITWLILTNRTVQKILQLKKQTTNKIYSKNNYPSTLILLLSVRFNGLLSLSFFKSYCRMCFQKESFIWTRNFYRPEARIVAESTQRSHCTNQKQLNSDKIDHVPWPNFTKKRIKRWIIESRVQEECEMMSW